MSMPHIGLHMIPEEADFGEDMQWIDVGNSIELVRFDKGMTSGRTSIGVYLFVGDLTKDGEAIFDSYNTWVVAETSLRALKTAVDALVARDEAEGRPL